MTEQRVTYLLDRYLAKICTAEEKQELSEIILAAQHDNTINIFLQNAWDSIATETDLTNEKASDIIELILHPNAGNAFNKEESKKTGIIRQIMGWKKIAIAAVFIFLIAGAYFIFFNKTEKDVIVNTIGIAKDIEAPKTTKAKITLSNGLVVLLDSITNGMLAKQGNVNVVKTADGQIAYNGSSTEVVYNTLINPRGSQVVNLTLNDGTKVWLNSESSIKYPVAFVGNERKVEITGEAYFEVSKNASKRFLVEANGVITEVLGTHFNVNSYADEQNIKVTLLEGAVKVTKGSLTGLLNPGQQAQISTGVKVVNGEDIDAVMAWKNGFFSFNKVNIKTIMGQISRWYGIEVIYEGEVSNVQFGGEMERSLTLLQVLKGLEKSKVHFRFEGNTVIVMP